METEIPAILRAREAVEPERFTFHSSRMRMNKVTREELAAMDAGSDRRGFDTRSLHKQVADKLIEQSYRPIGSTPAEFAAQIKTDLEKYRTLIKAAGITAQ